MTTNAAANDRPRLHADATPAQTVVLVNGSPEMLDTVLEAGHYDVVFVESSEHAYTQIKRVQPNVVILCVRIDDGDGFQVLSMLKLDDETRAIPVFTCPRESRRDEPEDDDAESSAADLFPVSKAAVLMN